MIPETCPNHAAGATVSDKVAACMAEHPAGLSDTVCRQRLRGIGGDGAICHLFIHPSCVLGR